VVETGGLENRFTLTGNGGSNPSPSANSTNMSHLRLGNSRAEIPVSSAEINRYSLSCSCSRILVRSI
jgi:hypothetical protein